MDVEVFFGGIVIINVSNGVLCISLLLDCVWGGFDYPFVFVTTARMWRWGFEDMGWMEVTL